MNAIPLSTNFLFLCIKIEFQKIINFLDRISDEKDLPRSVTKKWIAYDQSGVNYNVNKEFRNKTSKLRSDLCDYCEVYIVVKGVITIEGDNDANKRNKHLAFKNNAFINCVSESNGLKIDNAEDLDVVMPVYNLNTVKATEKQQEVCGIITEMNQATVFLLSLNLLNIKQVYRRNTRK